MLIIQRPTVEVVDEEQNNRQRFAIGPLDPGFGTTLGNSLRRTLLSSIPGGAVTQLRFDEALHEFTTLPGVKEDVTDIILNLKDLLVRVQSDEPVTLRLDVRGPADATAADLQVTSDVEILNPDLHIASVNAKGRLAVDVTVERGRGYASADKNKKSSTIGVIPIDSIFSPVHRVTFDIEPVRVEQSTNYDRLVLDIETDGTISPREALASAGDTLRNLVSLVADLEEAPQGLELGDTGTTTSSSPDLDLRIEELDLSERPRNCLKRAQINTIGELVERTMEDLLAITNFGQKSADEVVQRLDERGLSLRTQGLSGHAGNPQARPPARRLRRAPEGDAGQPGRLAHRRRVHRDHRGEGQGAAPRRREVRHRSGQGRRVQPPQRGGPHPGQGHGAQALRGHRAPLRRPARRLHPHPQAGPAPGRQRAHGADRVRLSKRGANPPALRCSAGGS